MGTSYHLSSTTNAIESLNMNLRKIFITQGTYYLTLTTKEIPKTFARREFASKGVLRL